MDEGKPTKAKWWNRPRPQGHLGESAQDGGRENPDGDFELARPTPPAADAAGSAGGAGGDDSDGDYELSRPVLAAPAEERASAAAVPAVEPASPVPAEEPASAALAGDSASAAPAAGSASVTPAGESAGAGLAGVPAARSADASETAAPAEPSPSVSVEEPVEPVALAPTVGDARPKPLHDPDPYSTPPYGEPGPWAPAPPVQHPAVTPAHGTTPPAPPAAPAVPAPAPSAPAPTPAAPAAASPTPAPTPAHAVPASGVPAPDPTPPASTPAAPAASPAPTPAHAVPGPASPAPPPTTPTPAASAPAPAPAHDPDSAPVPSVDPWYRYDPWAGGSGGSSAVGPLQQTGAVVLSREQRRKRARKTLVGGALGLALVSGVLGGVVGAYLERTGGIDGVQLPQASAAPAGRDADSVAGIAARALPSVVTLHVSGNTESGTGTGFVLDTRGHILTNEHVVEPAGSGGEITVVFNGGQTAEAEIVGKDSGYDLAVVKVSGVRGLTPLPLGNSDNVQVGDPVVAIGAPFDLEGTVTSGIISAKERPITAGGESGDGSDVSYVDALQTDAPINPGNSGGPLLDARGQVIGINSAIRSAVDGSDPDGGQAGSIGLGFAIPVNQGKRVAEELINTGKATRPVIGVTLDMDYSGDGARVGAEGGEGGFPVTPGGPGDRAGIRPGDVITAIDGRRVHSGEELIVKTRAHRPGDRLELTVERGGKERTLTLVLGSSESS